MKGHHNAREITPGRQKCRPSDSKFPQDRLAVLKRTQSTRKSRIVDIPVDSKRGRCRSDDEAFPASHIARVLSLHDGDRDVADPTTRMIQPPLVKLPDRNTQPRTFTKSLTIEDANVYPVVVVCA